MEIWTDNLDCSIYLKVMLLIQKSTKGENLTTNNKNA
ncbi:hypothetical protein BH10BAC5_BH10BAC5_27130 [soil metagenome]